MNAVEIRRAFEEMDTAARPITQFGLTPDGLTKLYDAVNDLPIYSRHPFVLSRGDPNALRSSPFLIKSDLRRNFPQGFLKPGTTFAPLVASKKVEVVRTSGTSSERLQVLWDMDWWDRQELWALRSHPVMHPHLNDSYREAVLTTPMCSESVCKTGPATMEERRVDNLLFLNTQHDPSRWNTADLDRMADELNQFQPAAMEADPVYIATLARYIRDKNLSVPKLRWIVLTYELVSLIDKSVIQSVFGCPVFEFYGLTEAGVFFLECPRGRHHFCGTDSIVEVLRPSCPSLQDGLGEVVVTTWGNTAAPLIRYRTNDLVTVDVSECACGMPGATLRQFDGRIRDLLEFSDGRIFTPRQIDTALLGTAGLAQYMCVQEQPEAVRVDYVQDGPTDPADEVHSRLSLLWEKIEVRPKRVSFISPEQSGKYRTIVPL